MSQLIPSLEYKGMTDLSRNEANLSEVRCASDSWAVKLQRLQIFGSQHPRFFVVSHFGGFF